MFPFFYSIFVNSIQSKRKLKFWSTKISAEQGSVQKKFGRNSFFGFFPIHRRARDRPKQSCRRCLKNNQTDHFFRFRDFFFGRSKMFREKFIIVGKKMLHDFLEIEFFPRFHFNGDQFMLEWPLMEVAVAECTRVV